MHYNRTSRLLSVVLVLALLIQMLPTQIFASQSSNTTPTEQVDSTSPVTVVGEEVALRDESEKQSPTDTIDQEAASNDVYIVEEIIEERSEYIKQFRMNNGLQMAVVYSFPVHYEENGQT